MDNVHHIVHKRMEGETMGETMTHWLHKQAELLPGGLAIEEPDGVELTFQELDEKSRSYARRLIAKGVKQSDKIAILSNNCPEFIIAVHAISYTGSIAVLMNTRLSDREIVWQLEDAEVSLVLLDEHNDERTAEHGWKQQFNYSLFAEVGDREADVPVKEEIDLDEGLTLMYTSGTTGSPKAVLHTYGNHWWSAIGSMLNLGLSRDDKWLSVLPMFHIGGLSIYFKSVIYGMPVHLIRKFEAGSVQRAIMNRGVTIMSAVTTMLRQLIEELGTGIYPEMFRCMLLGGGPVPKPLLEKAKNKGIPVFQSYGMTETSSQIATLSPSAALEKLGSSGKPLLPAQLKIAEPDSNGEGEIVVKGPMVVDGYYGNASATEKSFAEDGWLRTGDIGRVDLEGFLYVLDRRKDLIISGGENIYPAEIESVLTSHEEIAEAGVIGIPSAKWGNVPAAFIVSKKENLDAACLVAFCKERLAHYKCPRYFYVIDELPRNASGKLLRSKLVEIYEENYRKMD